MPRPVNISFRSCCRCSSVAERILGKNEVASSILAIGSKFWRNFVPRSFSEVGLPCIKKPPTAQTSAWEVFEGNGIRSPLCVLGEGLLAKERGNGENNSSLISLSDDSGSRLETPVQGFLDAHVVAGLPGCGHSNFLSFLKFIGCDMRQNQRNSAGHTAHSQVSLYRVSDSSFLKRLRLFSSFLLSAEKVGRIGTVRNIPHLWLFRQ